jgi:dihydropteroate synthase
MDAGHAFQAAMVMIRDGADIIDIGGESSRPGSSGVEDEVQMKRVLPVIQEIRGVSDIEISIDTRSAAVARAALDSGADIINDISGLTSDADMASLAAECDVPVILMHMKGNPADMQRDPYYKDAVSEVHSALLETAGRAMAAGVKKEKIILDPGIGFGKRPQDNAALLAHLGDWRSDGFRILAGLSRKAFLGLIIDEEDRRSAEHFRQVVSRGGFSAEDFRPADFQAGPEDRLIATVAAHAWCLAGGVDMLRVHDVREARQLVAVWEAISWAS